MRQKKDSVSAPLALVLFGILLTACSDQERAADHANPPQVTQSPRSEPQRPAAGEVAPDFVLTDQDGKRVSLAAARGEKVLLVFYRGHW